MKNDVQDSGFRPLFFLGCCLALLLLAPLGALAAPALLQAPARLAAGLSDEASYPLDPTVLQQLREGRVSELNLALLHGEALFIRKEQVLRDQVSTWRGSDAGGGLDLLLTLGPDHFYGRVTGQGETLVFTPDTATGRARVRRLAPGLAFESSLDYRLVPPPRGAAASPEGAADSPDDGSRIDLMVLYTGGMAAAHPGDAILTRIQYLVDLGNESFSNSLVATQFNLVHAARVDYPDDSAGDMNEALDDLTDNLGVFAGLEGLRDTHGADEVVLLRQFVDEGCGLAWVLTLASARYAYAVVHDGDRTDGSGYYCNDLTFTHEIGHNLGCAHDRSTGGEGRDPWSHGYQDPAGAFRTVMAYNCPGDCPRVSHFSNPSVLYQNKPTGIWYLATNSADCARTIGVSRVEMSAYRPAVAARVDRPVLIPSNFLLLK